MKLNKRFFSKKIFNLNVKYGTNPYAQNKMKDVNHFWMKNDKYLLTFSKKPFDKAFLFPGYMPDTYTYANFTKTLYWNDVISNKIDPQKYFNFMWSLANNIHTHYKSASLSFDELDKISVDAGKYVGNIHAAYWHACKCYGYSGDVYQFAYKFVGKEGSFLSETSMLSPQGLVDKVDSHSPSPYAGDYSFEEKLTDFIAKTL